MGLIDRLRGILTRSNDPWRGKKRHPRSVLFVCHANITRSASAAGMFKDLAEKRGDPWKVGSAGVFAMNGAGPNQVVQFILQRRGVNLVNHRSQPVTRKLLDSYWWIMVMENKHRENIINRFPDVADRVFVMRQFGITEPLPNADMPDPTGKEVDDFTELFGILDTEVTRVYGELENRVSEIMLGEEYDEEDN
jgi:protein-tyrosine-phosphatase